MERSVQNKKPGVPDDFRIYLQQILVERCQKNPSYSLRAFAKNLKINHSMLSRILSSKRNLTKKMRIKLANSLNLSPEEITGFENGKVEKYLVASQNKHYKNLASDIFHLIAGWQHDAILEIPRVRNFQSNPKWIAKALGISINEVNASIERLQRLNLLKIDSRGRWKVVIEDSTNITSDDSTDAAARKLQKQILSKAIDSIDSTDIKKRDNTSVTFAVDTSDIPQIKKLIKQFRRDLSEFVQPNEIKGDQVYQLAIAFFPLTTINEKESLL